MTPPARRTRPGTTRWPCSTTWPASGAGRRNRSAPPTVSDPADRRRHIVELSDRGRDELCASELRLACVEDDLLRALSDDERATLHDLLLRAAGDQLPSCTAAVEDPTSPGAG